jgi:hypothetical protein
MPLTEFWNEYNEVAHPFLHPQDAEYMEQHGGWQTWGHGGDMWDHLNVPLGGNDRRFHFSLQPLPFVGDLKKADVVFLMLNPRLVWSEYHANKDLGYRTAIDRTMRQDFGGCEFPFLWLDPELSWSDGFVYWEGRLRQVLQAVAGVRFDGVYREALQEASTRIALVELVPYYSVNFPPRSESLPSATVARAAAQLLAERARGGQAMLVIRGGGEVWGGLPPVPGKIVIPRLRTFSLSPQSHAGRVVYQRLLHESPA